MKELVMLRNKFDPNTWHTGQAVISPQKGDLYVVSIVFPVNLGVGSYSIATALHSADTHIEANYEWRDLALVFNVVNTSKNFFNGSNWIEPNIEIVQL